MTITKVVIEKERVTCDMCDTELQGFSKYFEVKAHWSGRAGCEIWCNDQVVEKQEQIPAALRHVCANCKGKFLRALDVAFIDYAEFDTGRLNVGLIHILGRKEDNATN